jgi:DNA polymerase III alpha subunit (gram-positive type)
MNYLVADIETSGLNLIKDVPVQFGYEVHSETRKLSSGDFYMKPLEPLSLEVQAIHGITNEFLAEKGISLAEGAERYNKLFWQFKPLVIVGYNFMNFDFPMIQNWLFNHNKKMFKHPPCCGIIDVMHLASIFFKTSKWPKLSQAAKDLGISINETCLHNATEDVRLTWEVYKKIREFVWTD